jgi:hypothetical protein
MPERIHGPTPRLAGLAAVFVALLFAADGQSRPQPGKQAVQKAREAARQGVNLQESHALKKAYILMAMGDHTYDGHRARAMHRVEAAVKMLDASIMHKGTNGQKVLAVQSEIAAARAAFLAKHQATVHESQALSDLQMRAALGLLVQVDRALVQQNQSRVRAHVEQAIQEVRVALAIR